MPGFGELFTAEGAEMNRESAAKELSGD